MLKLTAFLSDTWGPFFKEGFARKSRATRQDIASITWIPIIAYLIYKYVIIYLFNLFTKSINASHISISESTRSFKELLDFINDMMSIAGTWFVLIALLYIIINIISLIVRRLFDTGVPYSDSNRIAFVIVLLIGYTQLPNIITIINHIQTFITIDNPHLPFTKNIVTLALIVIIYVILQFLPTNFFTKKRKFK